MENALATLNVTKLDGFDVQTSLFSHRMVTIVFPMDGSVIPGFIGDAVKLVPKNTPFIGQSFATCNGVWDDYHSVHTDENYSGVEVETYAFVDAHEAHARVVDIVEIFLKTHTRTVTYKANS